MSAGESKILEEVRSFRSQEDDSAKVFLPAETGINGATLPNRGDYVDSKFLDLSAFTKFNFVVGLSSCPSDVGLRFDVFAYTYMSSSYTDPLFMAAIGWVPYSQVFLAKSVRDVSKGGDAFGFTYTTADSIASNTDFNPGTALDGYPPGNGPGKNTQITVSPCSNPSGPRPKVYLFIEAFK